MRVFIFSFSFSEISWFLEDKMLSKALKNSYRICLRYVPMIWSQTIQTEAKPCSMSIPVTWEPIKNNNARKLTNWGQRTWYFHWSQYCTGLSGFLWMRLGRWQFMPRLTISWSSAELPFRRLSIITNSPTLKSSGTRTKWNFLLTRITHRRWKCRTVHREWVKGVRNSCKTPTKCQSKVKYLRKHR